MARRESFEQDKARHWGRPVPEGLLHGRSSRARHIYGCQCEPCTTPLKRGG
jgi:hypothetical protein